MEYFTGERIRTLRTFNEIWPHEPDVIYRGLSQWGGYIAPWCRFIPQQIFMIPLEILAPAHSLALCHGLYQWYSSHCNPMVLIPKALRGKACSHFYTSTGLTLSTVWRVEMKHVQGYATVRTWRLFSGVFYFCFNGAGGTTYVVAAFCKLPRSYDPIDSGTTAIEARCEDKNF